MRERARFYLDLLERSLWTGLQAFLGAMILDPMVGVEFTTALKFKLALAAGGVAMAKCVLSTQLPWTSGSSASSLPIEAEPAN